MTTHHTPTVEQAGQAEELDYYSEHWRIGNDVTVTTFSPFPTHRKDHATVSAHRCRFPRAVEITSDTCAIGFETTDRASVSAFMSWEDARTLADKLAEVLASHDAAEEYLDRADAAPTEDDVPAHDHNRPGCTCPVIGCDYRCPTDETGITIDHYVGGVQIADKRGSVFVPMATLDILRGELDRADGGQS